MLTINKEVMVSIDTNLDRPQARRVAFRTAGRNMFYLELAMDKTEFIKLHDFDREEANPDRILEEQRAAGEPLELAAEATADADFLSELGL